MRLPFFLLALPVFAYAHDDFPTEKAITELLGRTSEKAEIYTHDKTKIFTIYLKSHEKAYLVPVSLADEGRNYMFRMALIRPAINQAQVLSSQVKDVDAIYDMDEDGISEIVATELYSGGGTVDGTKSLVQLDEWTPKVLLEREFRNNIGMYGVRNAQYYNSQCNWEFGAADDSTLIELRETCYEEEGKASAKDKKTKTAYHLVDGELKAVPWKLRNWEKPQS